MNMLYFKLPLLLMLCSTKFNAQEKKEYNIPSQSAFIKVFAPKYTKLQYAGGMGMFSLGMGWGYGKNHWETELLSGFAPTPANRPTLFTVTLKQNYRPWEIIINKPFTFDPLNTGIYINAILNDKKLFSFNPDRFPDGYYWHSERFRLNIFIGERLKYKLKNQNCIIKSVVL